MHDDDEQFNPHNRDTQIALLAMRVQNLGIEKEAMERREDLLEKRILKLENTYSRGAGIIIGFGMIGSIGGILIAYGRKIFAPWM